MRPKGTIPGSQPQPSIDWEEIQRQQEAERRRIEEEKRRRQLKEAGEKVKQREAELRQEFGQDKEDILKSLKTGDGSVPAGARSTDLTLKEPLFSKGQKGSAPPYLADLDPKWPIVVDPAKVQGGTPQALRTANRRTHWLLDALEMGNQNWELSIKYLENQLKRNPKDQDLQDALSFLRGLYRGYVDCRNIADSYYKYGVRKWLEGDYESAARAFAVAVRENPDDIGAYRTYAYMCGRRAGSGKHTTTGGTYSSIDIPDKKIKEDEVAKKLEELRLAASVDPQNLKLKASLNYYEGMIAYFDYKEGPALGQKPKTLEEIERTTKQFDEGFDKLLDHDYEGAIRTLSEIGKDSMDDQVLLFTKWFAAGRADARRGYGNHEPWDPRMDEIYVPALQLPTDEDIAMLFTPPDTPREGTPQKDEVYVPALQLPTDEDLAVLFAPYAPEEGTLDKLKKQLMDVLKQNPFFGGLSEKEERKLRE